MSTPRPDDGAFHANGPALAATFTQTFPPPSAQPPAQIPFSDPFPPTRDPFMPGGHSRKGSFSLGARPWPAIQGNSLSSLDQRRSPPPSSISVIPSLPLPPQNGVISMALPFDPSRRRSLGGAGSPPHYVADPPELPRAPPSFASRNMPPPSPPQIPPSNSAPSLPSSAPRGPPTTSPFSGVRELANMSSSLRSGAGMSIYSILGSGEDRNPRGSPQVPPPPTPKSMRPPSPRRARSSSMRESANRRDISPAGTGMFGEPRAASALHHRKEPDIRREGLYSSPQLRRESPHSFRAFRPEAQDLRPAFTRADSLGRPNSQPLDRHPEIRTVDEILRRPIPGEGKLGNFRHFALPTGADVATRLDSQSLHNDAAPLALERNHVAGPHLDRDVRPGPTRFQPGGAGVFPQEEPAGMFKPAFHHVHDAGRDLFEARWLREARREPPRSSPPISDAAPLERSRTNFADRPLPLEEHQRMHREPQRKESDGSAQRLLLNLSPELHRKGRSSPLPQAVQGAQPKHVGPGGNNPGIKMEFGRMFPGLGSGVGTTTPTAGQSVNGSATPPRLSPARQVEEGDLVRSAVAGIEEGRSGTKRGKRQNAGRAHDDMDKSEADGRSTPDSQRATKRSKTTHSMPHHHHHVHQHHHHHHHLENADPPPSAFNTLRFPSNPDVSHANVTSHPAQHHHHHHHTTHAHPAHHHHHHAPRSAPATQTPTTTVTSKKLLEDVASKPRKHLGSQLYSADISLPPAATSTLEAKIKYRAKMKAIPHFEGKENCTYTVRVPRTILGAAASTEEKAGPSALEEICRRQQLWGTDVYTDDSDVVAAAVHSGWLKGDHGDHNADLRDVCDPPSEGEQEREQDEGPALSLRERPRRAVQAPADLDAHITLLILPPLERYESTVRHHVRSRGWGGTHDGMSFMIHRIDFVGEGPSGRYVERGVAARKHRMAVEEQMRREAAAGLLLFANGIRSGIVRVGA